MSGTNLATCPKCGSPARRIRPNWWQRLFYQKRTLYRCHVCWKSFWAGG